MTRAAPWLVLLLALAFGLSPLLTPGFRGYDPGQFPVRIENPEILPAGYAFAIWGLIYAWLILHAGFGLWKRAGDPAWQAMRPPLILSLAVGTIWLWVAARSPLGASLLIVVMLTGALAALFRTPARPDRWLLQAPVAIYAGWLTAATGVSFGVLLAGYGWLSDSVSAIVMLVLVLGLAATVQMRLGRAPEYGLTLVWALIAISQNDQEMMSPVSIVADIGIGVMAIAALLVARRKPADRPA
jgi:hypothetical protein